MTQRIKPNALLRLPVTHVPHPHPPSRFEEEEALGVGFSGAQKSGGFPKVGVPYWGPYSKGILRFGDLS